MKKLKVCISGYPIYILVLLVLFSSCVNEQYDMEKIIVEETTVFENLSLPVGDIEKMTIEKVLFSDGEIKTIRKNDNGDMYMDLFSDSYATEFNIPSSFNLSNNMTGLYIDLKMGPLAGLSTSMIPESTITYSSLNGDKPFTTESQIEIQTNLPSEIKDLRKISLGSPLDCYFSVAGASITLLSGMEVSFPSIMHISKANTSGNYTIVDGHIIRLTSDTRVDSNNPLKISLSFDNIDIPAGSVITNSSKRYISMHENVLMKGDFSFNTKDVAIIPEALRLSFQINDQTLTVKSAEVSLDVDMNIPDQKMEITDLPVFFKGENICVDLYNPQMKMNIVNSTPVTFSMTTDILSYNSTHVTTLSLTEEDGISLKAGETGNFIISRRQTEVASGVCNIVKPIIGDLIKHVPDKLEIRNLNIKTYDEFVTVEVGKHYSVSVNYSVSSPLAFGEDLMISFTQDVKNLGLQLDLDIESVIFEMNLVNSIPVDFMLSAICLDETGNEVSETKVTLDKDIKAGSYNSPVTTPVKLKITNNSDKLNIDGLRLTMKAIAPESPLVGVCLNEKQGFEIKDIVMILPDGIGLEL